MQLNEYVLQGLLQIREDLLLFLYYLFVYTFKELYQVSEFEKASAFLQKFRNDFISQKDLTDEIDVLNAFASKGILSDKVLKDLNANKLMYLQQYTFETLQTYIKCNNLQQIYQHFLSTNKIQIHILKEPLESLLAKTNNNYPQPSRTLLTTDTVNLVNTSQHLGQISITPLKSDLLTMHKIDKNIVSMQAESNSHKKLNLGEYTHLHYLEDSDVVLPEPSLSSKINFYQNYVKRDNISISKEPSTLMVNLADTPELITCVEFSRNFDLLLVGQQNSTILCFFINPNFVGSDLFGSVKKSMTDNLKKAMAAENVLKEVLENSTAYMNGQTDVPEAIEFIGHTSAISSLSLQHDELYFLSASLDCTIRYWCIRQRACLVVFKEHFNTIWEVKFCPKGYFFASGSSDTTARLWVTDRSASCRIFKGHNLDVNVLEFAENCNYLLTGSLDLTVRVWNIQSGECARVLYHGTSPVKTILSSLKGGIFVTASEDGKIVLWDAARGEKKISFTIKEKKKLRGVTLAVDESYLCCYTQNVLQYFDVTELLKARDEPIFSNEGKDDGERILEIEPINLFQFEMQELFEVKFHARNFLIVVSRSQI